MANLGINFVFGAFACVLLAACAQNPSQKPAISAAHAKRVILFIWDGMRPDSISEIDTSKDDVGGAYMMGDDPVRGLVSSDNSLLYVANYRSQYVTIYSIDEGKRLPLSMTPHVGDGPTALALSSSGLFLFVVDNRSNDVAVMRTDTRAIIAILPTGRAPSAIAVKAFKEQ